MSPAVLGLVLATVLVAMVVIVAWPKPEQRRHRRALRAARRDAALRRKLPPLPYIPSQTRTEEP